MRFSDKLACWIDKRGVSQTKLSALAGVHQTAISEMTKGKRRPYMDQGFRIARALGLSLDFLADDAQDEPPGPPMTEDDRAVLESWHASRLSRARVIQAIMDAARADAARAGAAQPEAVPDPAAPAVRIQAVKVTGSLKAAAKKGGSGTGRRQG